MATLLLLCCLIRRAKVAINSVTIEPPLHVVRSAKEKRSFASPAIQILLPNNSIANGRASVVVQVTVDVEKSVVYCQRMICMGVAPTAFV